MTGDEALAEIAALVKERKLQFRKEYPNGPVRDENEYCPLCALAKSKDPSFEWRSNFRSANRILGLPEDELCAIVDGADLNLGWRRKVLLACGMSED